MTGQDKSGGLTKRDTVTPGQKTLLDLLLQQAAPYLQQSAQAYQQYLPGGSGTDPIAQQANQNYQQQTIPSILNAFGSDNKGSSSLNQALAASAANLNTNIASQRAQMGLTAAGGLGQLGSNAANLGTRTPQFAYQQQQPPMWQNIVKGGLPLAGALGGALAGGFPTGGIGAIPGALAGAKIGGAASSAF